MDEEKNKYLYKYRPLYSNWENQIDKESGDELFRKVKYPILNSNTLKFLKTGEIYFSSPSMFNDPYDCQFDLITNNIKIDEDFFKKIQDDDNFYWRINESLILRGINIDINDLITLYNETKEDWKSIFNEIYVDYLNKLKISCFSKTDKNFLMWSHYADHHRGICFGIEAKDNKSICFETNKTTMELPLAQVNYDLENNENCKCDIFDLTGAMIQKAYLSKFKDWKYEEEYRTYHILESPSDSFSLNINKNYLREIIFGSKTPHNIIKLTLQTMEKKSLFDLDKINFYQMKKRLGYYEFDKEQIDANIFL